MNKNKSHIQVLNLRGDQKKMRWELNRSWRKKKKWQEPLMTSTTEHKTRNVNVIYSEREMFFHRERKKNTK